MAYHVVVWLARPSQYAPGGVVGKGRDIKRDNTDTHVSLLNDSQYIYMLTYILIL